jgi:hypothetical protein
MLKPCSMYAAESLGRLPSSQKPAECCASGRRMPLPRIFAAGLAFGASPFLLLLARDDFIPTDTRTLDYRAPPGILCSNTAAWICAIVAVYTRTCRCPHPFTLGSRTSVAETLRPGATSYFLALTARASLRPYPRTVTSKLRSGLRLGHLSAV